jgi:hypothetical protein
MASLSTNLRKIILDEKKIIQITLGLRQVLARFNYKKGVSVKTRVTLPHTQIA